jgi:hypothetical protein
MDLNRKHIESELKSLRNVAAEIARAGQEALAVAQSKEREMLQVNGAIDVLEKLLQTPTSPIETVDVTPVEVR